MTIEKELQQCYETQENYCVKRNGTQNGLCYIYFSSNALYKKDDAEDFTEKIINRDRYEWMNLRAVIVPEMEIFVRDIWLSWYVRGINKEINSYDKLVDLLRRLTWGYTVRCVGASSGGFIGNIVAMKIGAEISYAFASQFSLRNHFDHLTANPYLKAHLAEYGDYWFEYYQWLKDTNIVYLFPLQSEQDQEQHDLVKDNESIVTISVNESNHGVAIYPSAVPKFISLGVDEARKLAEHGNWNKIILTIKVGGFKSFVSYIIRKLK